MCGRGKSSSVAFPLISPLSFLSQRLTMPKEFSRTQRLNELVQRDLAEIIRREVVKSDFGMLTVSEIDVAPDLKSARVYISILAAQVPAKDVIKYLNENAGLYRHILSQIMTTRTTPRLHFYHDSSTENGVRMSALINAVLPPKKEDEDE